MMKKTSIKRIAVILAAVLTAGLLAGCTPSAGSKIAGIGNYNLTYGEANFYARYYQASYEIYSGYYGMDPASMWSQNVAADETLEDTVKGSLKDTLEKMAVLAQSAADFGVELTEDDLALITDTAASFIAANDKDTLDIMTADQKSVEEVLKLMMLGTKVENAIRAQADTSVSDEEAERKAMRYVTFKYDMEIIQGDEQQDVQDDQDNREDIMNNLVSDMGTDKDTAYTLAEDLYGTVEGIKDGDKFSEAVSDAGYTATRIGVGSSTEAPSKLAAQAALEMKAGEISEPILDEENSCYYVIFLENDFDEDLTEEARGTVADDKENAYFDSVYEGLKDGMNISWNDKKWNEISFIDQGCAMKMSEEELNDDLQGSISENLELSTDPELVAEEGDKVNIDFSGSVDGEKFEGGTSAGYDLVLGSGTFIPGFEEQLMGHAPGEEFTIDVTFPEDYAQAELAGQEAQFEIILNGIYR